MREEMESAPPAFEVVISGRNMPDTEAKAKARKKAQYVSDKPVIITPAIPLEDRQKGKRRKLRIAAYCRVSTPTEAQVSSIENQKSHFIKAVAQHEDWVLVAVFADEYASIQVLLEWARGSSAGDFSGINQRCYPCRRSSLVIIHRQNAA